MGFCFLFETTVFIYMYTYVCICVRVYYVLYTYVYIYVYVYVYLHVYVYTYTIYNTCIVPFSVYIFIYETNGKRHLPFVCCKRKWKMEVCFPWLANDKRQSSTFAVLANVPIYVY
jgi:hypothetical protein